MKKILITGGTGFVGSHLVELLLQSSDRDIYVTTFRAINNYVSTLLPASHIKAVDLTDQTAAGNLIQEIQPDEIYHLAAFAAVGGSFDKTYQTLQNNLLLQYSVLEAIKTHAPQAKVLIIGSGMEYDFVKLKAMNQTLAHEDSPLGPISPYAISKILQDLLGLSYFYSYQLKIVRARPFNHIGERQSPDFAIPSFAKQIVAIERGEQTELRVGNLTAIRDFTDVKDMVKAYQLLMAEGKVGEVYNIGSTTGYPIEAVLKILCSLAQQPIQIKVDENLIRPLDIPSAIGDTQKIQDLGWQPTIPITATLQRIINYWRTQ